MGQHDPGILCRFLQPLLPFPVLPDAGHKVVHVQVGGLGQVVEAVQPSLHVGQFRLRGLQALAVFTGDAVHLLVHQPDQFTDVGLGEDVVPDPVHHHVLKPAGVEPGAVAGAAAPLHQRLADVVGELAALGVLARHGPAARPAPDQPAEQVGTGHPTGMRLPGGTGAQ